MTSPMLNKSKSFLKTAGALLLLLFFALYFWHCPIYALTGLPCPGCNFRSAAFVLLRGDVVQSLYYHAMLIPTAAALVLGIFLPPAKRKILVWIWAAGMLIYYGLRMLFLFNQPPMLLNWNAPLLRVIQWVIG